jgi:hypothetical protein
MFGPKSPYITRDILPDHKLSAFLPLCFHLNRLFYALLFLLCVVYIQRYAQIWRFVAKVQKKTTVKTVAKESFGRQRFFYEFKIEPPSDVCSWCVCVDELW